MHRIKLICYPEATQVPSVLATLLLSRCHIYFKFVKLMLYFCMNFYNRQMNLSYCKKEELKYNGFNKEVYFNSYEFQLSNSQWQLFRTKAFFFFFHFIVEKKSCILPHSSSGGGKERLDDYSLRDFGLILKVFSFCNNVPTYTEKLVM